MLICVLQNAVHVSLAFANRIHQVAVQDITLTNQATLLLALNRQLCFADKVATPAES